MVPTPTTPPTPCTGSPLSIPAVLTLETGSFTASPVGPRSVLQTISFSFHFPVLTNSHICSCMPHFGGKSAIYFLALACMFCILSFSLSPDSVVLTNTSMSFS